MRRAVFLDRDGVINRSIVRDGKPFAPTTDADFELLPGVPGALRQLRNAGFLCVVVTNQPDIAAGLQDRRALDERHRCLVRDLAIDAVEVCGHLEGDACDCRKPRPGMLIASAARFGISLDDSYMVGDRWRDVAAGQAAGCRQNFFIDYGYSERRPDPPFTVVGSLADAVDLIVSAQP